ncbi:MAG: hemerythrin domain-containing protein [Burkholderiaceae bacterium]|nr:hemerythrin domain-containing protein [Burkholderiaceae bacterium]
MLEACHERVQRTLGLLQRLREHIARVGADASARSAAHDVLRYFNIAAPLHHQDEELHVFPLLRVHGAAEVKTLVLQLQCDHVCMTADWAAARTPLQALVDGQTQAFTADAHAAFDRFAERYSAHIAAEEHLAYPAALALLPPAALVAMGHEMAVRRGAR